MTPDGQDDPLRQRQKSRARIMAALLLGFVILVYFISIAKMAAQ